MVKHYISLSAEYRVSFCEEWHTDETLYRNRKEIQIHLSRSGLNTSSKKDTCSHRSTEKGKTDTLVHTTEDDNRGTPIAPLPTSPLPAITQVPRNPVGHTHPCDTLPTQNSSSGPPRPNYFIYTLAHKWQFVKSTKNDRFARNPQPSCPRTRGTSEGSMPSCRVLDSHVRGNDVAVSCFTR